MGGCPDVWLHWAPYRFPGPWTRHSQTHFFHFLMWPGAFCLYWSFFFFFLKLSPQRFIFRLDTLCTVSPSLSSSLHPYFSLISLILSLFFKIFPIVPFFLFPLILHLTTRAHWFSIACYQTPLILISSFLHFHRNKVFGVAGPCSHLLRFNLDFTKWYDHTILMPDSCQMKDLKQERLASISFLCSIIPLLALCSRARLWSTTVCGAPTKSLAIGEKAIKVRWWCRS